MATSRLEQLQTEVQAADLDALALVPSASLQYLTGLSFHLMERPIILLVPASGKPSLVAPQMELAKTQAIPFDAEIFSYSEDPSTQPQAVSGAAEALSLQGGRLGVEPLSIRFKEVELLRGSAPDLAILDGSQTIGALRARKDLAELEAMRAAARVAEMAIEAILPRVEAGMTERELAAELVVQLLRHGSESELPFQPIVASGPNSALSHATVSDRELAAGELLLIDWGARVDGYCSDITRTFALGEIPEQFSEIYGAVRRANSAGRGAVAPGVPARSVDEAAREVIGEAGYGPQFVHRTGHGLGLEAHELPYIHAHSEQELSVGMAFTVEPGIYLPGQGGVRIEDDVIITEAGSESLTTFSRDLRSLL